MKIKIACFDPSLRNFGIARIILDTVAGQASVDGLVLVETETSKDKKARKNATDIDRALLLFEGMMEACAWADIAVAEVPVGSQSADAMKSYGICIGMLAACPLPLIQVSPTEVKKAACGYGTATKEEMIAWATSKWPEAPWFTAKTHGVVRFTGKNEHLADACGAFAAALKKPEFRQAIALAHKMGMGS